MGTAVRTLILILHGVPGVLLLKRVSSLPTKRLLSRGARERGAAEIRSRLVGGRAPERLHGPSRADDVGAADCHVFINSSLAPVVHFVGGRTQLVLKGIKDKGYTTARRQALMHFLWSHIPVSHADERYLAVLTRFASSHIFSRFSHDFASPFVK